MIYLLLYNITLHGQRVYPELLTWYLITHLFSDRGPHQVQKSNLQPSRCKASVSANHSSTVLQTHLQCKILMQETLTWFSSLHVGNKGTCLIFNALHMYVLMADSSRGYYKQPVPVESRHAEANSGAELCEWTRDTEGGEEPLLPN